MYTIPLAILFTILTYNVKGLIYVSVFIMTGAICKLYQPVWNFLIAFYIVFGFWYIAATAM